MINHSLPKFTGHFRFKNHDLLKAMSRPVLLPGSLLILFFLIGCKNGDDSSPFDEILTRQPFILLTDSIRQQPQNDELYFRRAVLLNKNNFPEPALADFQKAWSIKKQEKYAFGAANIWLDKNPDSAVAFLESALKLLPESYLLRISLARAYGALNRTEEALKVSEELLKAQPGQPEILLMKSELLEKKGDMKESIAPLENAYAIAPGNLEIGLKLAYKYAESKDPRTVAFCDTLINKDTLHLHADPYYVKGVYYSNINDKANALRAFDETIRQSYNYLNAYIEKGKILVEQKKYPAALKVFSLANTISPAFPDAYYWIGVCQEAMGQKADAKVSYEKAFSLDKSFTEAKEAADRLGGQTGG